LFWCLSALSLGEVCCCGVFRVVGGGAVGGGGGGRGLGGGGGLFKTRGTQRRWDSQEAGRRKQRNREVGPRTEKHMGGTSDQTDKGLGIVTRGTRPKGGGNKRRAQGEGGSRRGYTGNTGEGCSLKRGMGQERRRCKRSWLNTQRGSKREGTFVT